MSVAGGGATALSAATGAAELAPPGGAAPGVAGGEVAHPANTVASASGASLHRLALNYKARYDAVTASADVSTTACPPPASIRCESCYKLTRRRAAICDQTFRLRAPASLDALEAIGLSVGMRPVRQPGEADAAERTGTDRASNAAGATRAAAATHSQLASMLSRRVAVLPVCGWSGAMPAVRPGSSRPAGSSAAARSPRRTPRARPPR